MGMEDMIIASLKDVEQKLIELDRRHAAAAWAEFLVDFQEAIEMLAEESEE